GCNRPLHPYEELNRHKSSSDFTSAAPTLSSMLHCALAEARVEVDLRSATMGKAARNELRKLTATYLNNTAVALIVAALAVPLIRFLAKSDQEMANWFLSLGTWEGFNRNTNDIFVALGMLLISAVFHFFGRVALWRMED